MEKAGQTQHPDQARCNIRDLAEFLASPGTLHWGSLLRLPLIRAISLISLMETVPGSTKAFQKSSRR